jgi:hypothetical protein
MRARACDDQPPTREGDLAQQAVLTILLDAYPGQWSTDELARELTDRPDDFAERDRVDNAIRDLVRAGLAHRHGPFVFATRAAVRFDELET